MPIENSRYQNTMEMVRGALSLIETRGTIVEPAGEIGYELGPDDYPAPQRQEWLGQLATQIGNCTECRLGDMRFERLRQAVPYWMERKGIRPGQAVPGAGSINATLFAIGDRPGREEDDSGQPIMGRTSVVFQQVIDYLELDRERDVYTSNVVKCLGRNTQVYLPDGSRRRIFELVRDNYQGEVLSFNITTGEFEPRRVIATHRSELGERHWLKITYRGAKMSARGPVGAVVTNDHEFLTREGEWVRADQLNGRMINVGPVGMTEEALQIAVGSLLGDTCIPLSGGASLSASHSAKQAEWAGIKAGVFGAELSDTRTMTVKAEQYKYVRYCSSANRAIATLRHEFYPRGYKIVPEWLPDVFNHLIAAVWYLDDGYVKPKKDIVEFAANGFQDEDRELLVFALEKLGYKAQQRGGRIFLTADSSRSFLKAIGRFVPPSMRYKLGGMEPVAEPFDPDAYPSHEAAPHYAEAVVLPPPAPYRREKQAFCLTVEGNNNFVTPAGVVHNCMPPGVREPTKKEWCRCSSLWLHRQIRMVMPAVIMVFGSVAFDALMQTRSMPGAEPKDCRNEFTSEKTFDDLYGNRLIDYPLDPRIKVWWTRHYAALARDPRQRVRYTELLAPLKEAIRKFREGT